MKTIILATKFKDNSLSSVYIYQDKEYLRSYSVFSGNKIYCVNRDYRNNIVVEKTDLIDITDIEKIKNFDNKNYGGNFNG